MRSVKENFLLWGQRRIEKGAILLAPFSWIWGLVSWIKNVGYDRGIFSQEKVGCPVISIGNLVAGGTGKTPLTLLLASHFENKRVAILSRGYGSIPDEAMLLQRRLKGVRVYAGKNRTALAKKAFSEGAELIFIDDGFQYRRLYRDVDLVTLSSEDPFGKGHYLPYGFLRESPKRLAQADAILILGEPKKEFLYPYLVVKTKVNRVLDAFTQEEKKIEGIKVALFSGIARPERFRKLVPAEVVAEKVLFDHQKMKKKTLLKYGVEAKALGADVLLCTEKDAVKLEQGSFPLPIYYLEISSYIAKGSLENLIAKINQKLNNFI